MTSLIILVGLRSRLPAAIIALFVATLPLSAQAENIPRNVAVFPFELIDTSLEGPRSDQQHRLKILDDQLISLLNKDGRYHPVMTQIVREAAEAEPQPMHQCNRCPERIAQNINADLAITAWVQKVSNLILNVNLAIINAHTGRVLHAMSVSIRGNTDESWQRGLSYLIRNRLFGRDAAHIDRSLRRVNLSENVPLSQKSP